MWKIFDWYEPTISYSTLVIIGITMYILIFYLDWILPKNIIKKIHNYTESCVISCKDDKICEHVNRFRDDGYYLFDNDNSESCIITKWEISHFFTHMFLGYFTNIYISMPINIGFEIYENKFYNCGSYLDLIYNTLGFILGFYLKHGTII
jgi:hypothetical protein